VAVEPLPRGFGLTIGNPLRRILLSSTNGSAVTWVKIDALLYTTTDEFLQAFGLNRLSEMPKLKEVSELLEQEPVLTDQINAFK